MYSVAKGWVLGVVWQYYDKNGDIGIAMGLYLICDNGYLCWSTTICPYLRSETDGSRLKDLFSSNLESIRKDVECVFGILKSWWDCLDRGFKHQKMKVCGNIFQTCAVLHSMMYDAHQDVD